MHALNQRAARAASAVLCALLMLLLFPCPALAAEGETGGLSWSLSAGTLTITGTGEMPAYTDDDMPPWADVADQITRASVGEGVTNVGALTFYGCTNLRSVSLPSTVTEIGDRAFKFCRSLPYLRFPSGLESIGEAALESCESLNGIILPQGLEEIGDYAFNRCYNLRSITVPESVTELGRVAFAYCTGLSQAVVLSPIETLPDWSFYGCDSLSAVYIPDSVEELGEYALRGCRSLSAVFYQGDSAEKIEAELKSEPTTRYAAVTQGEVEEKSSSTGAKYNTETDVGVTTSISSSPNAVVTETRETNYTYSLNGKEVSLNDLSAATEEDTVSVSGVSATVIRATVENSEGWTEVARAADSAVRDESVEGKVQVSIQVPSSVVTAEDLQKTAGRDLELAITTPSGSSWMIDQSDHRKRDFGEVSYDLDFNVTKLEEINNSGVSGETVYALDFSGDTDFRATVGVPLKVGDGRKTATLYQKVGNEVTALETVVVDDTGTAWLPVAGVSGDTSYYVAVNAPSVKREDAIIPISLAGDYNMDEGTLIGSDGTRYKVTGRSSRWGITGREFAIYAAIGLGVVVLLVTLIMITMNKLAKSKAKYAVPPPDSSGDIDEEALRLELMKELLEEKKEQK